MHIYKYLYIYIYICIICFSKLVRSLSFMQVYVYPDVKVHAFIFKFILFFFGS